VHPVGVRVGGFYGSPRQDEVDSLLRRLEAALPAAEALVGWTAGLDFPDDEQAFISVAMSHPDEYAINRGNLISGQGLDTEITFYESHFQEHQAPHSTALHSTLDGRPYLVGPLARLNLNFHQLPEPVRKIMDECGIAFPSHNMFHSIVARAIELHLAIYEAIRLLENYHQPDEPYIPVQPQEGNGFGCTEAPRGILWHRYDVDDQGIVRYARIVPPTSQNQGRIEEDIRLSLERFGLENTDDALRLRAEQVIRNYDPCISCATHFLRLDIHRR
jgi:coenzyme F420-reducing hydrogenase alpha subunit